MSKRLPNGLKEFEESLHELSYAPELLKRLLDLPENGLAPGLRRFTDAMIVVKKAEETAAIARDAARRAALAMWEDAKRNWTVAELQDATGYEELE